MEEYNIDKARKEADNRFQGFTDDEIKHLRRKAKTNLFFLASGVLGYNQLSSSLHLDFCKWAKKTCANQFRLALLPRSHYKSTILTISDSIQIVLPDDQSDQPYPRNLGTNCRLLISHETSEMASTFLGSITQHFCINPILMGLFPECVPNPRINKINKLELELPRTSIWSEPTIGTVGVAGRVQGRHYNYIKCDDLYGAAARDSKAERDSTISWVNNLQALLISPLTDHIDFIGTRWAHDDVYDHLMKTYEDKLIKYIRSCEEYDVVQKKRVFIFPEKFTSESTKILKKDKKVWSAQYANNPYEGGSKFEEGWLKYYNRVGRNKITVFESNNSAEVRTLDIASLDKVILIDPAMSGLAGFCVTGTDSKKNVYVLHAEKDSWEPVAFVNYLFQQVIRWNPRIVVIEDVLFSGLYEHWLATEMRVKGIKFKVEPVRTEGKAKEVRVMSLSNYFSAGQIYFNIDQTDLIEEFKTFGATDDYHILDALSQGTRKTKEGRPIWQAAVDYGRLEMQKEAERKLLADRDPQTGYGSY